jgi:hypothetical protein
MSSMRLQGPCSGNPPMAVAFYKHADWEKQAARLWVAMHGEQGNKKPFTRPYAVFYSL